MSRSAVSEAPPSKAALAVLVEQLTARLQAGEKIDHEAVAREHPEFAAELKQLWPALEALANLSGSLGKERPGVSGETEIRGTLGDYAILREIGRGGMGVVYEAMQISLGRRVALKVLPFAATLDPRHLQRFINEARAAASLEHPHIVPVYAVGCERGVHYYAMRLIQGRSLYEVLQCLRPPQDASVAPKQAVPAARPRIAAQSQATAHGQGGNGSTLKSSRPGRQDWRRVAELAQQAAEALEHAHQSGVVHRDVKPANLLLDEEGKLWITDFGLAHIQSDTRLTMTGDLLGTLRYMSPEQALAKPVILDQRTDIYSLGATFYEVLTLRPVFDGQDRQELLRQIAFEEPVAPRRLNRSIPADLETIVLKAIQKHPADRYATAQELADDLGRFVRDEPIRAKRPSLRRRFRNWRRRHRVLVSSAAAAIFVALIAFAVGLLWYQDAENRRQVEVALKRVHVEQSVRAALDQAEQAREELHANLKKPGGVFGLLNEPARWEEQIKAAQAPIERASALLANAGDGVEAELSARVDTLEALLRRDEADRLLAVRLENIRMVRATWVGDIFDWKASAADYPKAFTEGGLDLQKEPPLAIAAKVRSSPIKEQLVAAIDDWANAAFKLQQTGLPEQLAEIGRLAAPDPAWGDRLRQISVWQDQKTLVRLVNAAPVSNLSPPMLELVGQLLAANDPAKEAWLRRAHAQYPADFWLNYKMGKAIERSNPEEACGFYWAAIAVRPNTSAAYNQLGLAFQRLRKFREAAEAYQKAIEIDPRFVYGHTNLGNVLRLQKKLPEALRALHKALEVDPNFARAFIDGWHAP